MPRVKVVALASSRNLRASAAVAACDVVASEGLPHASAIAQVTARANPLIERIGHSFPVGSGGSSRGWRCERPRPCHEGQLPPFPVAIDVVKADGAEPGELRVEGEQLVRRILLARRHT